MTDTKSLRTGAGYALGVGLYATHKAMTEAADTIDTLRAQLAKAQRDSERLDWIDQRANMGVAITRLRLIADETKVMYEVGVGDVYETAGTLRAAIDAAKG